MRIVICLSFCLSFNLWAHTKRYYPNAPLKIITIGHPTLTMVADEIPFEDITKPKTQVLIQNLIDTMKKAGGVGIAAPQVNISQRLFIIKPSFLKKAEVIINPKIEYLEERGKISSTEGCLSIPGRSFKVDRYKQIRLSYFNKKAKYISEKAKGFRAIVMQHEYDHLNGIMISDFFTQEFLSTQINRDQRPIPLM